jgi:hypothetical protein
MLLRKTLCEKIIKKTAPRHIDRLDYYISFRQTTVTSTSNIIRRAVYLNVFLSPPLHLPPGIT